MIDILPLVFAALFGSFLTLALGHGGASRMGWFLICLVSAAVCGSVAAGLVHWQ